MYNVLGSYKSIWYPLLELDVYEGENATTILVASGKLSTVPCVLVVFPGAVPVT